MKTLYALHILLLIATTASAEECVNKINKTNGEPISYEACTAPVEEALNTTLDGYRFSAYVIRFHGERVVVWDIASETKYKNGDQIHFIATKYDSPPNVKEKLKILSFLLSPPEKTLPEK